MFSVYKGRREPNTENNSETSSLSRLDMLTVSMQLNDKNYISSCHSKEYTENNISLTSLTLPRLGASGENTCAVMRLHGTCNFDGVAFISLLDLLALTYIYSIIFGCQGEIMIL